MKLDELKKIIKEELKSILKENKNVEIKYLRIQIPTILNKQNGEIEIINNMFIYPDPNGKYTEEEYLSLEKRKGMDKFKVTICKDKKEAEDKAKALKENAPAETKPDTKEAPTTKPEEKKEKKWTVTPEDPEEEPAKANYKDVVNRYIKLKNG